MSEIKITEKIINNSEIFSVSIDESSGFINIGGGLCFKYLIDEFEIDKLIKNIRLNLTRGAYEYRKCKLNMLLDEFKPYLRVKDIDNIFD